MATMLTKRIKVISRGFVTTSRGRCRSPITAPYRESVDMIRYMLTQENAEIVEVLNDGTELPVTVYNYSQDTSNKSTVPAPQVTPIQPAQPQPTEVVIPASKRAVVVEPAPAPIQEVKKTTLEETVVAEPIAAKKEPKAERLVVTPPVETKSEEQPAQKLTRKQRRELERKTSEVPTEAVTE